MHRVQHDLHSLLKARFLAIANRGVLEHQAHAMMPHVCAHIDGELQERETRRCFRKIKAVNKQSS